MTRLQSVEVEDISPPSKVNAFSMDLLMTGLRSLSQRTVVALASLVDLGLIASAFVLWLIVIREPTVLQLVGVGLYAVFVWSALLLRRRLT